LAEIEPVFKQGIISKYKLYCWK